MNNEIHNFKYTSSEQANLELNKFKDLYHVYVLCRPNGTPFYIGKGKNKRVFQHEREAKLSNNLSHKLNVIRKIYQENGELLYAFAGFFENEIDAFVAERNLIQSVGRYDLGKGPLTNQSDGGEGPSNPSEESLLRRVGFFSRRV